MKKLKIKKCLTSFLMLAVMVVSIIGVIPKNIVHAGVDKDNFDGNSLIATTSVKDDFTDGTGKHINVEYAIKGSDNVYLISVDTTYRLVSKETFTAERIATTDDGSPYSDKYVTVSSGNCKHYNYYYADIQILNNQTTRTGYATTYDKMKALADSNPSKYDSIPNHFLGAFLYDVSIMEIFEEHKEGEPNGSEDNPYEDKDIGTIVLKSHGFISTKNEQFMGDVSCSYDYYFKYKDKTSSGFSLTDNKYARTFIEVKVQNQCVLYNKDNKDMIEEYYPHYGEYYTYKRFPLESINNNTLRVGWGDVYSKWNDYSEHPLATNKKLAYRFMIRVVCTDSLTVIPDEKSGWYAGGWRSILFDGSKFVEETNGHVDKDGKWKDDKDDGHNNSSDKTSHNNESKDDVDKIMNDDSGSSSSVSNIKSFLKDVGNVPKAIGKLFSFLPSWCTDFIAFGFVVLVALMIIKAIRG